MITIDIAKTSGLDKYFWETKEDFDVYIKNIRSQGFTVYPLPRSFPCQSFHVADIPNSNSLDEEIHFFIYED